MLSLREISWLNAPDFPSEIGALCFTLAMRSLLLGITSLVLTALILPLQASGKKEPKLQISFHIETEATGNPKMIFPQNVAGRTRYFSRMPDISSKDIVSYAPFPSSVDESYGAVFKLKDHVSNRLAAITNANQGRWMIAQINGRVVDGIIIDAQVNDGRLVVWKSLSLADFTIFDEQMPRTGEEKKKKKK